MDVTYGYDETDAFVDDSEAVSLKHGTLLIRTMVKMAEAYTKERHSYNHTFDVRSLWQDWLSCTYLSTISSTLDILL